MTGMPLCMFELAGRQPSQALGTVMSCLQGYFKADSNSVQPVCEVCVYAHLELKILHF